MSDLVVAAFPAALQADAVQVAKALPAARPPMAPFTVSVGGEAIYIPYRLYNAEPPSVVVEGLPDIRRTMLACLYTRHHEGQVRQRQLHLVAGETQPWVAPFVVQLVGEYVVEIVLDVREFLVGVEVPGCTLQAAYGRFAAENPEFLDLTYQRAASYWDAYYRSRYATRQHYPAFDVLSSLGNAARQFSEGPGTNRQQPPF